MTVVFVTGEIHERMHEIKQMCRVWKLCGAAVVMSSAPASNASWLFRSIVAPPTFLTSRRRVLALSTAEMKRNRASRGHGQNGRWLRLHLLLLFLSF